MTEIDSSLAPSFSAVIALQRELSRWLLENALPVWDEYGVDRRFGGYFETLAFCAPQAALTAQGVVRRGRVVARQIYVFSVGQRLGWRPRGQNPVDHGCDYLFSRLHRGDGFFVTSVDAATSAPAAPFSLYEQSFYLLALAHLQTTHSDRLPIADIALCCLRRLRRGVGKSNGGFEESDPPSLPLKSNPHMHLLEAALAWIEVSTGAAQEPWIELAREIVGLCLTHFRDPATGAIREYFDYRWRPMPGDHGRIVEPGHQFEWAWLLMRWSALSHGGVAQRASSASAAQHLMTVGERGVVDGGREFAISEMWDDMSLKDSTAKLWPQTERVKAWCAVLERASSVAEQERACGHIAAAARGMKKYLRSDAPGLWYELRAADGGFLTYPTRASSLYHVVGAIDVLQKTVQERAGFDRVRSHRNLGP